MLILSCGYVALWTVCANAVSYHRTWKMESGFGRILSSRFDRKKGFGAIRQNRIQLLFGVLSLNLGVFQAH